MYVFIVVLFVFGMFFFVFFGWLFDCIGCKKIIFMGCFLVVIMYFLLFKLFIYYVNLDFEVVLVKIMVIMVVSDCEFYIFVGFWLKFSDCDKVKDFFIK